MRRINTILGIFALVVAMSFVARAADEPTTKPSAKVAKLTKPWSELASLSEEQKTKIITIHQQANAERKAIDDKEEADIMALLSDPQRAELKKMEEAQKAEAKAKRAEKKEEMK
jgi:hypothetical protein